MKISSFGIRGIPLGKHNVKDPRLDQADKLVDAQKKTYAQVDVVEEKEMITADAVLTADELEVISAHNFYSNRPVVVAGEAELAAPDALIVRAFQESGYISFLTVGGKENRAWPIRRGTTSWEAGGVIHSDIQKGFIRAEIIGFDDFIQ